MGLFRTVRRGVAVVSLGIAGGTVVVTARHLLDTPQPLQSALPGEGRIDRKHGGDVYYNVAGDSHAQPLVLLHDFYPGASNFEFRRVVPSLAESYRVYAPDWLGFGMSEHPSVAYTGEFYANSLTGFLRDVVAQPALVVAHGRAANIATRAASDSPELFERLALVSPFIGDVNHGEPTLAQTLAHTAQRASLGLAPYALLSTRPALRWLATRRSTLARDGVPSDETVEHLYASAHQFGGQHALLALLTGALDLPLWNAFALLEPPVLLISGDQDRQHSSTDMEDLVALNPHAELVIIRGAGDSVYEDQPEAFAQTLTRWLASPQERHRLDEESLLPALALQDEMEALEAAEEDLGAREITTEEDLGAQMSAVVTGGIFSVDDATEEPDPTGETMQPLALEHAMAEPTEEQEAETLGRSDVGAEDEALIGTPGSVVPGVSDAGQEGLATVVGDGVETVDESANMPMGAAAEPHTTTAATANATEPDSLLPEAGEAAPTDEDEQMARAGVEPPLSPETNIADDAAVATEGAGVDEARGDVAGLAEIVQTPDVGIVTVEDAVATPAEDVITDASAVTTSEEAVISPIAAAEAEADVTQPSAEAPDEVEVAENSAENSAGEPVGANAATEEVVEPIEPDLDVTEKVARVRPVTTTPNGSGNGGRSTRQAATTRSGARETGAHRAPAGESKGRGARGARGSSASASSSSKSGGSTHTGREGQGSKRGRSSRSPKK